MIHIDIFKNIATTNLPGLLYQQLEPHLDLLYKIISDADDCQREHDRQAIVYIRQHHRYLQAEFDKAKRSEWVAFARESWSEIDDHYYLDGPEDVENMDWK